MSEYGDRPRKKATLIIMMAGILLFSSCRSLDTLSSKWLSISRLEDGRMEDFSKSITSHLYENGMLVGVGNDEKYLYIFFSPDIRHYERPPSLASLTLWLDGHGKKAREYGFIYSRACFRESDPGGRVGREHAGQEKKDAPRRKPTMLSEPLLQFIDRPNKKQLFLNPNGSQGPQVHFSSAWGDCVYSWRIPLIDQNKENVIGLNAKPGQTVDIGLLWEIKPLLASHKADGHSGAGSEAGGAARPGRGGRGMANPGGPVMGHGNPRPGTDFNELPGSIKIWLKIILAQNK